MGTDFSEITHSTAEIRPFGFWDPVCQKRAQKRRLYISSLRGEIFSSSIYCDHLEVLKFYGAHLEGEPPSQQAIFLLRDVLEFEVVVHGRQELVQVHPRRPELAVVVDGRDLLGAKLPGHR